MNKRLPLPHSAQHELGEVQFQIGSALDDYANDHHRFPATVSSQLHQLQQYGDMLVALKAFEGGQLRSYTRSLSSDLRSDKVVLTAIPAGLNKTIKYTVTYRSPDP